MTDEIKISECGIRVGDKFPTKNSLLSKMGYPKSSGNVRLSHLKDAKRYVNFENTNKLYRGKSTGEIIITEIYETALPKKDGRIDNTENKQFFLNNNCNFLISINNMHKSGIYKIQYNNIIYIGQTKDFQIRYCQHKNGSNIQSLSYDTSKLLTKGGTFEILELEDNKQKRLEKEAKWILAYKNNPDFYCVNGNNGFDCNKNKTNWKIIKVQQQDYNNIIDYLKENNIEYR